ncbi:cbb3-type cytochrome oxidase assembly protein CcoS [Marinobacterium sp. D7]|uniref:cbb3-type cytochrome oxidase assembly protein CcoS n=1 Tax=Marinobacterium ramblicola TaxID=2849041 RepID=UPI001C2D00D3|nr:cbb3-type cytochrome oxidase assembly protein CcoS [Marinobacterium ramblicola]MBV1786491.1 cbb3-type cytochrome oxidase assembly protein CcoS [Marinobacterium ramblicola]
MSIVYLLIPIAIILASIAIWAFFWSVNTGQYDDLESPAHSILYDDDEDLIPEDAKIDKKEQHNSDNDSTDA